MDIFKLIIAGFVILIPSFIMGVGVMKLLKKEDAGLGLTLVFGQVVGMALFELVGPLFTFLDLRLTDVMLVWGILLIIVMTVSIKRAKDMYSKIINNTIKYWTSGWNVARVLMIAIVLAQIGFSIYYGLVFNSDDWWWTGEAVAEVTTNKLWHGGTEVFYGTYIIDNEPLRYHLTYTRYILEELATMYACIAKATFSHPTLLMRHTIMVIVMMDIFVITYNIGQISFNKDCQASMFVVFAAIVKWYNNLTWSQVNVYFYGDPWQGKLLMSFFIWPIVLYIFMNILKEKKERFDGWWFFLLIVRLAGILTNIASAMFTLMIITLITLITTIVHKNFRYIRNAIITSIPDAMAILVYLGSKFLMRLL